MIKMLQDVLRSHGDDTADTAFESSIAVRLQPITRGNCHVVHHASPAMAAPSGQFVEERFSVVGLALGLFHVVNAIHTVAERTAYVLNSHITTRDQFIREIAELSRRVDELENPPAPEIIARKRTKVT